MKHGGDAVGRQITPGEALANATGAHHLTVTGGLPVDVARDLVGLHNTSPVSPYLSLRARIDGFERSDLDVPMWDRWDLVRFRAMRMTMFVFPLGLLEVAAAATRHLRERWAERWLRDVGLTQREFDRLADSIDDALADGPLTSRALRQRLDVPKDTPLPGVVSRMCDTGRLVGGAPPTSWRSPARNYHRWIDALPGVDLAAWPEDDAVRELVRRYLVSYGPVTLTDVAWWTGLTKARCGAAIESLGSSVEEVAVEGWAGPLYRLGGAGAAVPADLVAVLPLLDPYVQGYKDRVRFLDQGRHDYVYDGGGNAAATIVRDGRIIGVWQTVDDPAPTVRYHLFADQPNRVRQVAEAELAATGEMYFDAPVDIEAVADMVPLSGGGGRSAMHPLDEVVHRAARRRT